MTTSTFHLTITCADGLENALITELDSFGMAGKFIKSGRVAVTVSLEQFYHICLYSRVASRVLLPLGEYHFKKKQIIEDGKPKEVISEDVANVLYDYACRLSWVELFGLSHTFAIRLSVDKRVAVNQQFATMRVKDAIADTFNAKYGSRPNVDGKNPNFSIMVHVGADYAEFALDLSGTSLHRRGYRIANTAAPLKENLAAALLYECGWHLKKHDALIDPMCGSGTFVIEALLMRADYPVGIDKANTEFGFYHWQHHDETLWRSAVSRALRSFHENLDSFQALTVLAFDAEATAVQACHRNLMAAGLGQIAHRVSFLQKSLSGLSDSLATLKAEYPLIITNPPYGERLGEGDVIKPLYQGLGVQAVAGLLRAGVSRADMGVLASHVEQADTLPIDTPSTLRCHNGALTVYFRHGRLKLEKAPSLIERFEKQPISHEDENVQAFINRLQKNLSHLKKEAKKARYGKETSVSNLRIYDADLPNFNIAVDLYGNYAHVQEYAPPKQIDPETAKARFNQALLAVRQVLSLSREQVFIKTRAKQSGNEQYTKNDNAQKQRKYWLAEEGNAVFYVNFTDYLDTGLFIDHRAMRRLVGTAAQGKRVLNLFSYTCTASVQAALGGAKSVVSVDLSANYLDWGRANFALNGLDLSAFYEQSPKYQFIAADVFEWIKENTERFDVIFIDPPTFSNSKKFKGTFDVQRDHVALINRAMNRLSSSGVLYFSNNYTRFELDESLKQRYDITDITHQTIGFDFDIKKPIHQSYEIRHKNSPKMATDVAEDTHQANATFNPALKNTKEGDKKFSPKGQDKNERGFAKETRKVSDKPSGKPFSKTSAKASAKSFEKTANPSNKRKSDKPFFDKADKGTKKTFSDGHHGKQKSDTKPTQKRLFVNPKLANKDEIEQRLSKVLDKKNVE